VKFAPHIAAQARVFALALLEHTNNKAYALTQNLLPTPQKLYQVVNLFLASQLLSGYPMQ